MTDSTVWSLNKNLKRSRIRENMITLIISKIY